MKKFQIKDKIILITGVEGQLGNAFTNFLLSCGAKVIGIDIKKTSSIVDENYYYIKADITKVDELKNSLIELQKNFYLPNVLINNAAIDTPPGSQKLDTGYFEDFSEDIMKKVIDVNIFGLLNCCKIFGASIKKNYSNGSIINISSIYGIVSPDQSIYDYKREKGEIFFKPISYSATKGSLFNITRYLSTYWAKDNIRVNTLSFAGVFNNQDENFLKNYCSRIPLGRMANPEDYFGPLYFLCSEMSSYVTGANIVADGGWTAI
tara:strand:- start:149 stop:937 length:789 start_codon:yes stop_codon:yes gene_type:complete